MLRLLEVQASVRVDAIADAALGAADMSLVPAFWRAAAQSLEDIRFLESLRLEEVTSVLLSWLHDSAAWEREQYAALAPTPSSSSRPGSAVSEAGGSRRSASE